ncbi:hypothetical protein GGS21DRAFT_546405 [Xylaria nigripes]|nr:hypothetical protein GGS21DRAFT_546405 [Xylaria nigripes]
MSLPNELQTKPLFTRELLERAEAELAKNGKYITLGTVGGSTIERHNELEGVEIRDAAPDSSAKQPVIIFCNERIFLSLFPHVGDKIVPLSWLNPDLDGPNRTEEETRKIFTRVLEEFEESEEAAAITRLIKEHLQDRAIDKVIAFGLSTIGYIYPLHRNPEQSFHEHAAALFITKTLREVSTCPDVKLFVQEPRYTSVCKKVLPDYGMEVVGGFGAKGFLLIDEKTVAIAHHPNFPFRQIIADLTWPAVMCMREQKPESNVSLKTNLHADADSVRSRRMLQNYYEVSIKSNFNRAFFDNTWFIKKV